jgi:glutamyl-tRNA synthetase
VHRAVDARFAALLPLLRQRMERGADYLLRAAPFYAEAVEPRPDELVPAGCDRAAVRAALEEVLKALRRHVEADGAWDAPSLEALVKQLLEERGAAGGPVWQMKGLAWALRVAATGATASPPLFDTLAALGWVRCAERLAEAARRLG